MRFVRHVLRPCHTRRVMHSVSVQVNGLDSHQTRHTLRPCHTGRAIPPCSCEWAYLSHTARHALRPCDPSQWAGFTLKHSSCIVSQCAQSTKAAPKELKAGATHDALKSEPVHTPHWKHTKHWQKPTTGIRSQAPPACERQAVFTLVTRGRF